MPFLARRSVEAAPLPYDPRSPQGLAARWLQWVAAAGLDESPIDDRSGEQGSANQPSDVWFLAGCRGGQVHRRMAVPSGRDLFFPVINWWFRAGRAPDMSPVLAQVHGSVAVDGRPLAPHLIETPEPFVVAGARFNDITLRTRPRSMVTSGLWRSVPALDPGTHELRILAGDGFSTTLDVRYELLVTVPGSTPRS
jgi:hypothetical protein